MKLLAEINGTKWYDGRGLGIIIFKDIPDGSCVLESDSVTLIQRPSVFGIENNPELQAQAEAVRGMVGILEDRTRIHFGNAIGKSGPAFTDVVFVGGMSEDSAENEYGNYTR